MSHVNLSENSSHSVPPLPAAPAPNDFILERYKNLLQEMRTLDENAQKYLTFFQTLATTIIGGGVAVFVGWKKLAVAAVVARGATYALLSLLTLTAFFVVVSVSSGMVTWWVRRTEEVRLTDEVVRPGFRKIPDWRNCWRWQETYIILFPIATTAAVWIYTIRNIIPYIR